MPASMRRARLAARTLTCSGVSSAGACVGVEESVMRLSYRDLARRRGRGPVGQITPPGGRVVSLAPRRGPLATPPPLRRHGSHATGVRCDHTPKVARNSSRSVLKTPEKRWNCKATISMLERLTGKLRATLSGNHGGAHQIGETRPTRNEADAKRGRRKR